MVGSEGFHFRIIAMHGYFMTVCAPMRVSFTMPSQIKLRLFFIGSLFRLQCHGIDTAHTAGLAITHIWLTP